MAGINSMSLFLLTSANPFEMLKNNFPSLIHGIVVSMFLVRSRANTSRPTIFNKRRNSEVPILDTGSVMPWAVAVTSKYRRFLPPGFVTISGASGT